MPEHVVRYLLFVAEGVRELMAAVGVRRFDDLVGRTDLLRPANADRWPWLKDLDLEPLLHRPGAPGPAHPHRARRTTASSVAADHRWMVAVGAAERGEAVEIADAVRNTDRSRRRDAGRRAGARSELRRRRRLDPARRHRRPELRRVRRARHDARRWPASCNDYCGKGLSGGRLIVAPAADAAYVAEENVVCGNVALYGATGGRGVLPRPRGRALLRAQLRRDAPSSRASATTAAST